MCEEIVRQKQKCSYHLLRWGDVSALHFHGAISFEQLSGNQETPVTHDLFFALIGFKPDVEAQPNDIDVRA